MDSDFVVVWNGVHGGEDRDLFSPVEFAERLGPFLPSVRAERVESVGRMATRADYEARIWRVLRADQWVRATRVVEGTGLSMAVCSWALRRMARQGRIEVSTTETKCFGKYMCLYRRSRVDDSAGAI